MRPSIRRFTVRLGSFVALGLVLLLVPAVAAAQATPVAAGPLPAGITVLGFGEASAPATSAQLQIMITRGEAGPPQAPVVLPGATPGASQQTAAAPVVAAVAANGVPRGSITVFVSPVSSDVGGPGGPAVARVDFTLRPITANGLQRVLNAAVAAASNEGLTIGAVGINYQANDCVALDRAARAAAFKDARTRAQNQAATLGVKLGTVIASADQSPLYAPLVSLNGATSMAGGCAPLRPVVSSGSPYGLVLSFPSYDPAQPPEVDAYVEMAVTFAIVK